MREILTGLDEDPPVHSTNIVLNPPNESGSLSDEDSANEDDGAKYVNNIEKRILNQKGEVEVRCNQDADCGNGFDDEENSEVNCTD